MRYLWTLLGIVVVVGTLAAVKATQIGKLIGNGKQAKESGPPPESVAVARAQDHAWENTLNAVGNVATQKGVALSNELAGIVTTIRFESGARVAKGQPLVELDTSVERAQLAAAQSRRSLATTTFKRTNALTRAGSTPPSQLDDDTTALKAASKDVEGVEAQIDKKTIRAPFAGRLGIRAVNLGQYLNAGTVVTVLETDEALHVDFTLPQQLLSEIHTGLPIRITMEGNEAGAPIDGTIAALDPTVDATTRSIKLRANVPNEKGELLPGMFVNVSVVLPNLATFVTVPATAMIHAAYGDSVFIVEDKKPDAPGLRTTADGRPVKVVHQQFVRPGRSRGDFVAILEGLKPGDEVVTTGAFKLRNGSPIVIDAGKQPVPEFAPRPENR